MTNRFGRWLFNQFFKSYTEKVWGVSTSEIRAEWAAQRIKGLSFFAAAKNAFFGNRGNKIKSLISEFNYPRYGPGQMWEKMRDEIRANGGEVRLNAPVTRLRIEDGRVVEVVAGGETLTPSHVISSLPLRTTVGITEPEAPGEVRDAARGLRYRDFLTVLLVIEGEDLFPDNWIYIHDPSVEVGRIQNFRSWSPWMVPNDTDASIGMEYFCFEGDELWSMPDDDLVAIATREIQQLGLARAEKVKFGFVVRVHKAYPIYDAEYAERVADDPGLARRDPEPDPGRPQRPAPLQQLRPLDADRDAGRRQHPPGHPPRHLGGQRRERVPRGGRRGGAALPRRSGDAGDGAAARVGRWAVGVRIAAGLCGLTLALPGGRARAGAVESRSRPGSRLRRRRFQRRRRPRRRSSTRPPPRPPGSSGLSGDAAIGIAIGAIALLTGISFFIWRDARRRAPLKHHAAHADAGVGARSGSKAPPKPRKLSAAERKRRKRGRAR